MFKIQVLNQISPIGLSRLPPTTYAVGGDLADPDAILLRSADLHGAVLPTSLKAIGRAGAGVNNIPLAECSARGIPVFNTPGANANAVKELVIAGMLLATRKLAHALKFVDSLAPNDRLDDQVESQKKRFAGQELFGKTLGVIGLGAIGVKVANAARALGMHVLGFDPHMTVEGAWQLSSDVKKAGGLAELFGASDFVSLHVPLAKETTGLFNPQTLACAKPGLILLNFSREGIVDNGAILQGLQDDRLSFYVSDFPSNDFLGHPKVVALPHLGASTAEAEENCAIMVVDQIRDYLESGNIANSVNFPTTRMQRGGTKRICIANRNVPNMIGQISHVLGEERINIAQMHNASRGELAYNLVDVESEVSGQALEKIAAITGVLTVRAV